MKTITVIIFILVASIIGMLSGTGILVLFYLITRKIDTDIIIASYFLSGYISSIMTLLLFGQQKKKELR